MISIFCSQCIKSIIALLIFPVLLHPLGLPETTGRKAESDIEEELEVLIRPLDEL